ncbi:trans-sulfuration enzyme family protein [Bradyrhizobium sp. HKCCYLRH2060]|uniref:trans-sulfuration enzyme family protein n=1 Tax=Bradyrhizobium TaxID=374 RepID=UPI0029163B2A|nr:PLP-dependent transferase [Bradyrhizobium sp. SZCCHNR3003]
MTDNNAIRLSPSRTGTGMPDQPCGPQLHLSTRAVQATAERQTPQPAIQPASTVFFDTVETLHEAEANPFDVFFYGGMGTPAVSRIETAVAQLELGERAILVSSGSAAVTAALIAFARAGQHLLVADTVASSTRRFCETVLRGLGVEIEFYDPAVGVDIARLLRPGTCAVYMESPGSLSLEMQDVPAIAAAARSHGVITILDNSWGAFGAFRPFEHGVDVVVVSLGKQAAGHADLMLGALVTSHRHAARLKDIAVQLGHVPGALESYLALRGLRSLPLRGERQLRTTIELGRWFAARADVRRVLCPALPGAPGHELWRRDCRSAAGLLTIAFAAEARDDVIAAINRLALSRLGFGWGGAESLVLPILEPPPRQFAKQPADEFWVRLSTGLEEAADLIADWSRALDGDA